MRTAHSSDPLLIAAKIATILCRVIIVIGMIALGIGGAIMLLAFGGFADEIARRFNPEDMGETTGAVLLIIVATMIALSLMYDFATRLAQLIDTVGLGDPFTSENAARLARMGWLVVAIQVLGIPIMLLSTWLEPRIKDGNFRIEPEFAPEGIFLILILFILARVFREGARLKADLEGTV